MMFSKEEIANEMKIFLDEKDIYIDEPMSKHTTFKIGGKADVFVKLRNTDQIENLLNLCFKENIESFMLNTVLSYNYDDTKNICKVLKHHK